MKKILVLLMFTALCVMHAADVVVSIPKVADRWIKADVLTKQNSAPWSFAAVLHGFVQLKNPAQDDIIQRKI